MNTTAQVEARTFTVYTIKDNGRQKVLVSDSDVF